MLTKPPVEISNININQNTRAPLSQNSKNLAELCPWISWKSEFNETLSENICAQQSVQATAWLHLTNEVHLLEEKFKLKTKFIIKYKTVKD